MTVNQQTGELLQPEEVAAAHARLTGLRGDAGPVDIAINGDVADDIDPAATISRYERAGATWWAELCSDTPDEQRRRIRQGPAGRQ